jgi:hypothetical protein
MSSFLPREQTLPFGLLLCTPMRNRHLLVLGHSTTFVKIPGFIPHRLFCETSYCARHLFWIVLREARSQPVLRIVLSQCATTALYHTFMCAFIICIVSAPASTVNPHRTTIICNYMQGHIWHIFD